MRSALHGCTSATDEKVKVTVLKYTSWHHNYDIIKFKMAEIYDKVTNTRKINRLTNKFQWMHINRLSKQKMLCMTNKLNFSFILVSFVNWINLNKLWILTLHTASLCKYLIASYFSRFYIIVTAENQICKKLRQTCWIRVKRLVYICARYGYIIRYLDI